MLTYLLSNKNSHKNEVGAYFNKKIYVFNEKWIIGDLYL